MRRASRTGHAVVFVSWLLGSCASVPPISGESAAPASTPPSTSGTLRSTTSLGPQAPLSVRLFNKTVIYVKDAYFDPTRVHPREMLVAALRGVGRAAPQLRVETPGADTLTLVSGEESRTFDLTGVDSLWKMCLLFSEIYQSLTGPLGIADPSAEIGFAATNGMLSTLDRRSRLLRLKSYEGARKTSSVASAAAVTSHVLTSGIGYVRLGNLPDAASSRLRSALTDLSQPTAAGGRLRGVIVDLRGNPGGLLQEAIRVTSLFVEDGVVLTTVALGGKQREVRRATRNADFRELPLVVVVDERTGGGAEIIAAALKDLDRAIVVGERTPGAGTVQVIYEFAETEGIGKGYLKLTIAEMLRSSGSPLELVGVVPDVRLAPIGPPPPAEDGPPPEELDQGPYVPDPATRPPTEERSLAEVSYPRTRLASATAPFVEDFPIRFAQDLLLRAPFARRSEMLSQAKALAAEAR